MRLAVSHDANYPQGGEAWYRIDIAHSSTGKRRKPTLQEMERLVRLSSQIETMAKAVLGDDFIQIFISSTISPEDIGLCVKSGTSTGKKRFAFRAYRCRQNPYR